MSDLLSWLASLASELRRRHVFHVAGLYAVVAWLVIQVATQTFPYLHLPQWAATLVIALAILGFPIALVLAWAYDLTHDGVIRTVPATASLDGIERNPTPTREHAPTHQSVGSHQRHNLPMQLSSFIGREREIEEAKALLAEHHLITLTGAGGCGKTRFALETASQLIDDFPDGVWLVELAPLTNGDLLPRAVGAVLALSEVQEQSMTQTLAAHLYDKRLLLLLDNCEHVVQRCSELAGTLLRAAPGLRVLATSREALNIQGEHRYQVSPLSVPPRDPPLNPERLGEYDAVRLFVDRAAANQKGFALNAQNATAVARICQMLDGIPLALELAAARVRILPPSEILARLEDRFGLLTGGSRTDARHRQTLRATVDWSHDLLGDAERRLFRRLSVFVGGFDLAAAESVCADDTLSADNVVTLLSQLIDKSLVIVEATEEERRYRMLETLRQYGREKLCIAGEEMSTQQKHLAFYLALAERAYAGRIEDSKGWLARLEREHDNLRIALDFARAERLDEELRLAGALAWFWHLHAHIREGCERVSSAMAGRNRVSRDLARASWGAGMLTAWQGDTQRARTLEGQSLQMWRDLGDQLEVALALEALGWIEWLSGEDEYAKGRMEESFAIQTRLGDPRAINRARLALCQVLVSLGDVATAEPLSTEALRIAKEHEDPKDIHSAYHFLADCALYGGDLERAGELYTEALRAAMEYGDTIEASFEVEGIAMAAAERRPVEALRLAAAALEHRVARGADMQIRFWNEWLAKFLGYAREQLGPKVAAATWDEGKRMVFEEVVESALELRFNLTPSVLITGKSVQV